MSRRRDVLLELPAHPLAAEAVLALSGGNGGDTGRLAVLIECDVALSARLLRLANSAAYGGRQIASVRQAVRLLGIGTVRGMTLRAACEMTSGRTAEPDEPPAFWRHALTTAASAAAIAPRVGADRDEAFTTGLLHDVGTLLLHRRDPVALAQAHEAPTMADLLLGELGAFGETHPQAGADALEAWGFPAPVVEAVASHHGVTLSDHPLVTAVRAGQALSLHLVRTPGHPQEPDEALALREARIEDRHLAVLGREVQRRLADLLKVVGG